MKRTLLITIALSPWMWADTARYTRSDAGIVTDNKTGLQWQDDYSDNGGNIKRAPWIDDIAYCEALSLGGYDDWRLPNYNELYYLADRSRADPAIDPVFQNTGSCLSHYWSSTTWAGDKDYALYVDFCDGYYGGNKNFFFKDVSYYVRCVRGGK